MRRLHLLGIASVSIVCVLGLLGCQQRPEVPTVQVEPTEPVVIVVVTATSQPTLAPTSTVPPTITPIPTLTPPATQTVPPTVKPTVPPVPTVSHPTASSVEPTAEQPGQATQEAATPQSSFPAPKGIAPQGLAVQPGQTITFRFSSVGPLSANQCYRIDMTLSHPTGPGAVGDYWVGLCGDQSSEGSELSFEVKPGRFRDAPNYGTLLVNAENTENIPATPQFTMRWSVTVVQITDATDPIHPKTEALSPSSATLENSFFR